MKRIMIFFGIIAIISCSKKNSETQKLVRVNESDIQHIREAYSLGLYFINIAQIAQKKAASNDVKELAQRSVMAYKQINNDLISLATEKAISLPKNISDEQRMNIQKLLNEEGVTLDKKLVIEIKDSNSNALALYQQLYIKSEDDDISYWALNKLSGLNANLDYIKVIQKKFKIK